MCRFVFTVRLLKEELQLLQEPGSYVGEVIKVRAGSIHGHQKAKLWQRCGAQRT